MTKHIKNRITAAEIKYLGRHEKKEIIKNKEGI